MSNGYGGVTGFPSDSMVIVLAAVRDSGGLGNGPYSPKVLGASVAVKPELTIEPSDRNRTKTIDVEDVRVNGTSEPSGGNLKDEVGVQGLSAPRYK